MNEREDIKALYISEALEKCQIIPEKDPFEDFYVLEEYPDGDPRRFALLDAYYNKIESIPTYELYGKMRYCRDAYDELDDAQIGMTLDTGFAGTREETAATLMEACNSIYDTMKRDIDLSEKDAELIPVCKKYFEIEDIKKNDVCPIINNNALALYYEISRRKQQEIDNLLMENPNITLTNEMEAAHKFGTDMKSGKRVIAIERRCLDFPLVKDFPYIDKRGEKPFLIRLKVNETPSPEGRIGQVEMHKIKEYDVNPKIMAGNIWNSLPIWKKRNILMEYYEKDVGYINPSEPDRGDLSVGFMKLPEMDQKLIIRIMKKEFPERFTETREGLEKVGVQACAWAAGLRPAAIIKDEDIAERFDELNPVERAEYVHKAIYSLEKIPKEVVNTIPRQLLFEKTALDYKTWTTTKDLSSDYFGNQLTGILYQFMAKAAPRVLVDKFLETLEVEVKRQKARGIWNYKWIQAWLGMFPSAEKLIKLHEWKYITEVTEIPILDLIDTSTFIAVINREGGDLKTVFKDFNVDMRDFIHSMDVLENMNLEKMYFNTMSFNDKIFNYCTFTDCDFIKTSFNNCRFSNVRFIDCNFSHGIFNTCRFDILSFENPKTSLYATEFHYCIYKNLTFANADMKGILLRTNVDEGRNISMRGSKIDATTIIPLSTYYVNKVWLKEQPKPILYVSGIEGQLLGYLLDYMPDYNTWMDYKWLYGTEGFDIEKEYEGIKKGEGILKVRFHDPVFYAHWLRYIQSLSSRDKIEVYKDPETHINLVKGEIALLNKKPENAYEAWMQEFIKAKKKNNVPKEAGIPESTRIHFPRGGLGDVYIVVRDKFAKDWYCWYDKDYTQTLRYEYVDWERLSSEEQVNFLEKNLPEMYKEIIEEISDELSIDYDYMQMSMEARNLLIKDVLISRIKDDSHLADVYDTHFIECMNYDYELDEECYLYYILSLDNFFDWEWKKLWG